MQRNFKTHEFHFDDGDLSTPEMFLKCLERIDPTKVNEPTGYASKLFQTVTNRQHFDGDEWFEIAFDIGSRDHLKEFVQKLSEWHVAHNVTQQFLPDLLADSFTNTLWVKEDLTRANLVPGESFKRQPSEEQTIEARLTSFNMH